MESHAGGNQGGDEKQLINLEWPNFIVALLHQPSSWVLSFQSLVQQKMPLRVTLASKRKYIELCHYNRLFVDMLKSHHLYGERWNGRVDVRQCKPTLMQAGCISRWQRRQAQIDPIGD